MIFESHAHYDADAFAKDREELLRSLPQEGIGTVINVCAAIEEIDNTIALAEKYPHIYGAVGVHPDDVGGMNQQVMEKLQRLCRHPKVAAIGEIGLDYYWDKENHQLQKKWFEAQMELAREEQMPFIIHSRDAGKDTLDMMRALRAKEMWGGVVHCFSYSREMAREYIDMGLYLGIGGVVTFANGKKLKEVVADTPIEQILLETDCPYLAPVPYRGKRNSSLYLPYIAEEIGRIKGISGEEVIEVTHENGKKLFRL